MKKAITALIILTVLATPAFAQTPANKISPSEAREANQLGRRFSQRLLRTKDIDPLIDEYFARDFLNGCVSDKEETCIFFLDRDVATKVSREQLHRFFVAQLNWFYLDMLYFFSKRSSLSKIDSMTPAEVFPPDVLAVFRSDPLLKATIEENEPEQDDSKLLINSVDRFWNFLEKLETANRLLRKHARSINAGRTAPYRETMSDWSVRYFYYDPWLSVCEENCYGLEKGTRIIVVNVPVLQLELAKVRGRMQIVMARVYIDD